MYICRGPTRIAFPIGQAKQASKVTPPDQKHAQNGPNGSSHDYSTVQNNVSIHTLHYSMVLGTTHL